MVPEKGRKTVVVVVPAYLCIPAIDRPMSNSNCVCMHVCVCVCVFYLQFITTSCRWAGWWPTTYSNICSTVWKNCWLEMVKVDCWSYVIISHQWPYFRTPGGYSHMVRHAGSPICIAHTDVTLTSFKAKVPDLLNFWKLDYSTSTSSAILPWRSQLMGGYDGVGPSLQLFWARFLNFSPSWRSRDFKLREMLISPASTAFYLRAGRG